MNRPLLALAVALVALGSLTRLACSGGEEEPAAPDAPSETRAPAGPVDLVVPGHSEDEREASQPDADEPEEPETTPYADLPLLLEGLVIDGRGTGVPGATVRLERHIADTGGIGMRMVEIQPLPQLTTHTDVEGRFEVRGEESGEIVVSAAKDGFVLRKEVECVLPATRVTLVVERSGSILVTVAPVALELAEKVYVEVRPPGGERDVRSVVNAFHEGRVVREELLPGPYDVVVVGRLSRRALQTVTGVQVREGETTEDPRLQDLDLRAVMHKIRVTVVDPDDQPVPGVTVWVHHGFGENGQKAGDDGSIELAAGMDGVDVAVRETGWRNVRHRSVAEDLVIRLERPLALRLVRPAGRSAELGNLYLYVEHVQPEGDPRASEGGSDWTLLAGEDAVEVGLDAAGIYNVQWAVAFEFAGRGTANFFPRGVAPQVVEVAEGEGTKEVTLALDSSAVDELLTRMGKLADELEQQPGETADEHERRVLQVILRENRR